MYSSCRFPRSSWCGSKEGYKVKTTGVVEPTDVIIANKAVYRCPTYNCCCPSHCMFVTHGKSGTLPRVQAGEMFDADIMLNSGVVESMSCELPSDHQMMFKSDEPHFYEII